MAALSGSFRGRRSRCPPLPRETQRAIGRVAGQAPAARASCPGASFGSTALRKWQALARRLPDPRGVRVVGRTSIIFAASLRSVALSSTTSTVRRGAAAPPAPSDSAMTLRLDQAAARPNSSRKVCRCPEHYAVPALSPVAGALRASYHFAGGHGASRRATRSHEDRGLPEGVEVMVRSLATTLRSCVA